MRFLLQHWSVVSSQLSCPAASGNPDSCFQCVDMQVAYCISAQPPQNIAKIEGIE